MYTIYAREISRRVTICTRVTGTTCVRTRILSSSQISFSVGLCFSSFSIGAS